MAGQWQAVSVNLAEGFARALDEFPEIERRKMFGFPCAFLNGHMFTGLHEQNWIVRLAPGDRAQLLSEGGRPFAPMGRVMKEYVVVPTPIRDRTSNLRSWLEKSLAYVRTLPPKKPKITARKRK